MNPVSIGLLVLEEILKYAPAAFAQIKEIINQQDVTVDQIRAKRLEISQDTYKSIVTNSQL